MKPPTVSLNPDELHKLIVLANQLSPSRLVCRYPGLASYFARLSALGDQIAPRWHPPADVRTDAEACRAWARVLSDLDRLCNLPSDDIVLASPGNVNLYDLIVAECLEEELPAHHAVPGPEPSVN